MLYLKEQSLGNNNKQTLPKQINEKSKASKQMVNINNPEEQKLRLQGWTSMAKT